MWRLLFSDGAARHPTLHTRGGWVCTNGGLGGLLGCETSGFAHPGRLGVQKLRFGRRKVDPAGTGRTSASRKVDPAAAVRTSRRPKSGPGGHRAHKPLPKPPHRAHKRAICGPGGGLRGPKSGPGGRRAHFWCTYARHWDCRCVVFSPKTGVGAWSVGVGAWSVGVGAWFSRRKRASVRDEPRTDPGFEPKKHAPTGRETHQRADAPRGRLT